MRSAWKNKNGSIGWCHHHQTLSQKHCVECSYTINSTDKSQRCHDKNITWFHASSDFCFITSTFLFANQYELHYMSNLPKTSHLVSGNLLHIKRNNKIIFPSTLKLIHSLSSAFSYLPIIARPFFTDSWIQKKNMGWQDKIWPLASSRRAGYKL